MSSQRLQDGGDLRKYFSAIPHIADDDLDVYEYRLYGHYKRVCGDSLGSCWESTRTTAEATGISIGKVSETRKALEAKGYITITEDEKDTLVIRLSDIWLENVKRYSDECSPHEHDVHHTNTMCSPGEPKKNHIEEESIEEEYSKESAAVEESVYVSEDEAAAAAENNIFHLYETILKKIVPSSDVDILKELERMYPRGLIEDAMQEAALYKARSPANYMKRILEDWQKRGRRNSTSAADAGDHWRYVNGKYADEVNR